MTHRVLVVEDEEVAAAAHAAYVSRTPGFEVAGVARSGAEAFRLLEADRAVDLILLDMRLPDLHGLEVLREARRAGCLADVIAVTGVRDLEVVRRAMAVGVSQYVLKPFTYAVLRAKLEAYAARRARLDAADERVLQADVDALFDARPVSTVELPKGLAEETLRAVRSHLDQVRGPRTAAEVARAIGTSRVTARRYLEHLVEAGALRRTTRHGHSGRPEVLYATVERAGE